MNPKTATSTTQTDKGQRLYDLHQADSVFVVPNPWDIGSARLLEQLGFDALASSGGGMAFASGRPDGSTSRDDHLRYLSAISQATDLPVTADLEDGFGDEPEDVHATILAAAEAGVVGGSIEDRTYRPSATGHRQLQTNGYDLKRSVARIEAAVDAAASLDFRFTVTARCDNLIAGRPDLAATITRLQAYQEAGAHCLYPPGVTTTEEIRAVVSEVERPVNVVVGLVGNPLGVSELADLGVKRISLGSTLARYAMAAIVDAANEIRQTGTFTFAADALPHSDACKYFEPYMARPRQ